MGFKHTYPPIISWHDSVRHDSEEYHTEIQTSSITDDITLYQINQATGESQLIKFNQRDVTALRDIFQDIYNHLQPEKPCGS